MRAVVQRVSESSVAVDGKTTGAIGKGFMVLLGVADADGEAEAKTLAAKVAKLRVFADAGGKMNLALRDVGGAALVISQFTLYGDASRGNRPSFVKAARPVSANALYELFCAELAGQGIRVEKGIFGAHMDVSLVNDGPVTILIDSDTMRKTQ